MSRAAETSGPRNHGEDKGRVQHASRQALIAAKRDLLLAACEVWFDADWRERPGAHTELLEAVRSYVRTLRAP